MHAGVLFLFHSMMVFYYLVQERVGSRVNFQYLGSEEVKTTPRRLPYPQEPQSQAPDISTYLVVGDWGGQDTGLQTTPAEIGVAKGMGHAFGMTAHPPAAIISLGDHVYDGGVSSVDDPRWNITFEHVFSPSAMGAAYASPWRPLLGNHDHEGNASAQLAYSSHSPRWHFHSLYYDWVAEVGNGWHAHFVMIDAFVLAGECDAPPTGGDPPNLAEAEKEWTWIEETLARSDADFLIVAGHYPVWSVCGHGPCYVMRDRLRPLLEQANASLMLSGHDHCAQHLHRNGISYHGIGAGFGCDNRTQSPSRHAVPAGALQWWWNCPHFPFVNVPTESPNVNGGVGAFASLTFSKKGLVVDHYNSTGQKLYTARPIEPRHNKAATGGIHMRGAWFV
eukprot:gnl/TRDRNA2_/TRDRNA2_48507_c0_seq1.p1 gnl/TRDRNA2_/TRDRNA2_48507_c0~~gnl/TRDRNA2_/TRDRNA2_48507_c0_seq1.p1  ORF type:complete len:391 (+),score=27.76 gnl/TRDRNA2_/TRDRNA2_48507_c0_seq1:109-1281(+)